MVLFLKEIESLAGGIASFFLKEAVIRPLPKKLSSDPIYLYNYSLKCGLRYSWLITDFQNSLLLGFSQDINGVVKSFGSLGG